MYGHHFFLFPSVSSSSLSLFFLSFSFPWVFLGLIWFPKRISYTFLVNCLMIQKNLHFYLVSVRWLQCSEHTFLKYAARLLNDLRWRYTGRFATSIFCATQRSNVGRGCKHSEQCRNNVETICCVKNRRCKLSRVTSPLRGRSSYWESQLRCEFRLNYEL